MTDKLKTINLCDWKFVEGGGTARAKPNNLRVAGAQLKVSMIWKWEKAFKIAFKVYHVYKAVTESNKSALYTWRETRNKIWQ